MEERHPRLRTVDKSNSPYPLNRFPKNFPFAVGRELIYLLLTKGKGVVEGPEWEEILPTQSVPNGSLQT